MTVAKDMYAESFVTLPFLPVNSVSTLALLPHFKLLRHLISLHIYIRSSVYDVIFANIFADLNWLEKERCSLGGRVSTGYVH